MSRDSSGNFVICFEKITFILVALLLVQNKFFKFIYFILHKYFYVHANMSQQQLQIQKKVSVCFLHTFKYPHHKYLLYKRTIFIHVGKNSLPTSTVGLILSLIISNYKNKTCWMSEECIQHVCNKGCWVLLGHSRFVGHRPDLAQTTVIRNEGSKGMNSRYGSKSQLTWKRCIKRLDEQLRGIYIIY